MAFDYPRTRRRAMDYSIDARTYRSPNHNARPAAVSAIVIHTSEGQWDSDAEWLRSPKSGVSSHYIISPAGAIYQLVPEDRRAWHAGVSNYLGLSDWNDFSIGIELSHTAGTPRPAAQSGALTWLAGQIIARYKIAQRMVVAHRWIAQPAGRKVDPTDWPDADLNAWIASLYSGPKVYQVLGLPVYQRQDLAGAVAGHLDSGAHVTIDATYGNGAGHLQSGLGFVDMDGLGEP